jgi:hypothetical protein
VKIDVVTRLVGVKNNMSSGAGPNAITQGKSAKDVTGPTLLHLLAWEAGNSTPDILQLIDKWQAIIAAADLSYRQVV